MTNLILLILLMVVPWIAIAGKPSKARLFTGLGVIGAIMLFVATSSATAATPDWGPALAILAFVGTFGLIYFVRSRKKG